MAKILIPIPSNDFDPTEAAVPWRLFREAGHEVVFATPTGAPGVADPRMVTGKGLGVLAPSLRANAGAIACFKQMSVSREFLQPLRWAEIQTDDFHALMLPGGHASGMRPYLESAILQLRVAEFFERKIVGAICHGVVLAARSKRVDGRSVLYDRKTTALPKWMELAAWSMTRLWLGDYYRTYPTSVEAEVRTALKDPSQFERGPLSNTRDDVNHLERGFVVKDRNYVSSRWPGDAHRFASEFLTLFTND